MAVFAAIIHAAANEMDSGRLDRPKRRLPSPARCLPRWDAGGSRDASHYFRFRQRSPLRTDDFAGGPMNSGAQRGATLWGGSGATLGVALRFLGLFVLPIRGEAAGLMHVQHRNDK
jgi:hypothetical protein